MRTAPAHTTLVRDPRPVPRRANLWTGGQRALWLLALVASVLLPCAPSYGGGTPLAALGTACPTDQVCTSHSSHAPRCTQVEHQADHEAVPQSGKPPLDAVVPAAWTMAANPSADAATPYATQPPTIPILLATSRLRL